MHSNVTRADKSRAPAQDTDEPTDESDHALPRRLHVPAAFVAGLLTSGIALTALDGLAGVVLIVWVGIFTGLLSLHWRATDGD